MDLSLIKLLLEHNADVNKVSRKKHSDVESAMVLAAKNFPRGSTRLFKLLLEHNGDPQAQDKQGNTVLQLILKGQGYEHEQMETVRLGMERSRMRHSVQLQKTKDLCDLFLSLCEKKNKKHSHDESSDDSSDCCSSDSSDSDSDSGSEDDSEESDSDMSDPGVPSSPVLLNPREADERKSSLTQLFKLLSGKLVDEKQETFDEPHTQPEEASSAMESSSTPEIIMGESESAGVIPSDPVKQT
jgi:ankyrin repeat protein